MSGHPAALRDMIAQMTHGGRIAMLGLPTEEISVDFATVVLNMLTIKGIYGREMFETWYAMSVLVQGGLDISGVITDRFSFRDHEQAFATARDGRSGKVIMIWDERDERDQRGLTDVRRDQGPADRGPGAAEDRGSLQARGRAHHPAGGARSVWRANPS